MSILHDLADKIHALFHDVDATIAPDVATLIAEEHKFREAVANEMEKVKADLEAFRIAAEARIAALEGHPAVTPVPPKAA